MTLHLNWKSTSATRPKNIIILFQCTILHCNTHGQRHSDTAQQSPYIHIETSTLSSPARTPQPIPIQSTATGPHATLAARQTIRANTETLLHATCEKKCPGLLGSASTACCNRTVRLIRDRSTKGPQTILTA
jgi:hypothetical protein